MTTPYFWPAPCLSSRNRYTVLTSKCTEHSCFVIQDGWDAGYAYECEFPKKEDDDVIKEPLKAVKFDDIEDIPVRSHYFRYATTALYKKGRFCNHSKIDTLISKRLTVENKAKLSQLTRAFFGTLAKLTH